MSQPPAIALPLLHAFRELIRFGVPLGVRDYLDAVRALDSGFGQRPEPTRDALLRLCQIMWCRSEGEQRLLDAIFDTIPPPTAAEVSEFGRACLYDSVSGTTDVGEGKSDPDRDRSGPSDHREADIRQVRVTLLAPSGPGGVGLPHLELETRAGETLVLQREAVISSRDLAVLWWRFRRCARAGFGSELDVDRTVDSLSRQGVLRDAVLRPGRRNTAELLILVDVSPSMAPWQGFVDSLRDSISLSRLRRAEMFYFSNVPDEVVFSDREQQAQIGLGAAVAARRGMPLLIISDAGAAKGQMSRGRLHATREFINGIVPALRPIVWINPMPQPRWRGTTALALARGERRVAFFALERNTLIRAIDVLRCARAA